MSRSKRRIIIGLVVVGALLYAFNMGNVLFWDDADWITNNPCVQEPVSRVSCLLGDQVLAGIGQTSNYYRPFLMFTFAFNWALGGAAPFGYHLVSNALHIANAVLIFLLLTTLLKSGRVAAVAAAFWLVHPLQTEAVTYISGRGDPLSVFLMLIAILLWLRGSDSVRKVARYQLKSISFLSAVLAILSRETATLLPLYLTIVLVAFPEVLPLKVEKSPGLWASLRRALVASWPFYAISAVYGLLRLTVLNFANTLNWYGQSNIYTDSVLVRVWTFLQVLWEYLRLVVAPVGLHMERNVPVLTAPWQYPAFMGIVAVALATWWAVYSWRRGNRIPFFGVLMFLVPLAPSSGILAPINSLIYEHWLYLSLVGIATLLAVYGVRLYDWLTARRRTFGITLLVVVAIYGVFLSVQTVRRNIIWGNPEKLYLQILQYESGNVRVLNNLANLYADEQKMDDAERYWLAAIAADPSQPAPYHNLGNLNRDRGELEAAEVWYRKALAASPSFWYSYQNLAAMYLKGGRSQDAASVLLEWQTADPAHPLTYYVLAQMLQAAGRPADARTMLEAGLPAVQAAGAQYEQAFTKLLIELQ